MLTPFKSETLSLLLSSKDNKPSLECEDRVIVKVRQINLAAHLLKGSEGSIWSLLGKGYLHFGVLFGHKPSNVRKEEASLGVMGVSSCNGTI